ncbi:MAG: O-antigen translocase [Verrucomicrobiia bacterium]|jgi:PST family polysaccharide transporter
MLSQPKEAVKEMQPALVPPSQRSYGQILKSSALVGGSSMLNIVLGIVRTKALALFLGPAGFGLYGLYGSVYELTRCVAGLGINSSGVRQIAEAVGTGDSQRIAHTVTTLRRVAFFSGAFGAVFLVVLCEPVSRFTFGDYQHAGWVALLALAVWLNEISAGQAALVQGMRRISDLAKMSVLGAFYGTLLSIPIVYFFREKGIVPFLICVAAMSILTSWWYARKIQVERVQMTARQIWDETSALLRMGVVFMASGLLTMGAAYLIRVIVLRSFNLEAAGCFQAAWMLGGLYVGFILQAMGADFFPRLTAVANNNPECNRLVNEQTEVGLLLAGPGVIATLTFAPLIIHLFYSSKFEPAADILRWICLGMMLRVASWPMGFIMLAKGERKLFFWSELLSSMLCVGLVWVCLKVFGLSGTGIGFFGMYAAYWTGIYMLVRRLSGFRWSVANRQLALVFLPLVGLVFVSRIFIPYPAAIVLGVLLTLATGIYSVKVLTTLIPLERFPGPVRKIILLLKLGPPSPRG